MAFLQLVSSTTSSSLAPDDPTRSRMCTLGVCEIIIELLNIYAQNQEIVLYSLTAIKLLLRNVDCRQNFSANGGCKLIANLLRDPSDLIAPQVCGAFANLVCGGPESISELSSFGATLSIFRTLRKYHAVEPVASPACAAILTLTSHSQSLRTIRKSKFAVTTLKIVLAVIRSNENT